MQGNENIIFCSRCGSRNNIISTFCSSCGSKLNKINLENMSISEFSGSKNVIQTIIVLILGIIFLTEAVSEIPELMEDLFKFDVISVLIDLAYLFCELAGLAACILTGIRIVKNNDKLKIPIIVLLIIAIIYIIPLTLFSIMSVVCYSYGTDYVFAYITNYTIPYICIYVILLVLNIYKKK